MLPEWPDGTVAVLSTAAGPPHAIPVSTAVRSGDATIHLALALRRESLARLREDRRCALTVLAAGVAVTAHATAAVVEEGERVALVRLDVDSVQTTASRPSKSRPVCGGTGRTRRPSGRT